MPLGTRPRDDSRAASPNRRLRSTSERTLMAPTASTAARETKLLPEPGRPCVMARRASALRHSISALNRSRRMRLPVPPTGARWTDADHRGIHARGIRAGALTEAVPGCVVAPTAKHTGLATRPGASPKPARHHRRSGLAGFANGHHVRLHAWRQAPAPLQAHFFLPELATCSQCREIERWQQHRLLELVGP